MNSLFKVDEIKGNRSGPRLLVTAGVHGDEYEGIEAVRRLASEIKPTTLAGELVLVAVVNESAHALDSRAGEDGLDLARTCPGKVEGTLTERVAHELSNLIQTADAYIDLHTGGKAMKIDPLVGYMLVKDPDVLERQREMAEAFDLPIVWGTSGQLDGRSLSVARDAGVPAIYAEYLGGESISDKGADDYYSGCLGVMHALKMIGESPEKRSGRKVVIEDDRDQSGHLQICHQSPEQGIFSSTVELAAHVKVGDLIGKVDAQEILAEKSGRVICLRVDGAVEREDSLAVILETEPAE